MDKKQKPGTCHYSSTGYAIWQQNSRGKWGCTCRECDPPISGVGWDLGIGKWETYVTLNGRKKHLGYYEQFHNAVCARLAAEECLDLYSYGYSSPAYVYVQEMLQATDGIL